MKLKNFGSDVVGVTNRTQVECDYENGKWVPSWHGNQYTLAKRGSGHMHKVTHRRGEYTYSSEQDLSFIVATLDEAQAEVDKRNAELAAGTAQ